VNDIELAGCRPEPLLSYLKALGVFRLVAEQADSDARAFWRGDTFCLLTKLDRDDLKDFLLNEYQPTPILAPWNGGSGFFPKDHKQALEAIKGSTPRQFAAYRRAINVAQEIVRRELGGQKPASEAKKLAALRRCRAEFPDEAVGWLDAVYALTTQSRGESDQRRKSFRFAPLLGSGGNDGRTEFSNRFMQCVYHTLLDADKREQSPAWLLHALFHEANPQLLVENSKQRVSPSLFSPANVEAPNAVQGFRSRPLLNPWDFILGIEGTLMLAGAVSRRLGGDAEARATFPFTVTASAAGWPAISSEERTPDGRNRTAGREAEVWLPLWERPASYQEIKHVFSEGRAQVGRRPRQARTGVDFARAIAQLGVDRGVREFRRYGLLTGGRSGRAHLAVPLGRLEVRAGPPPSAFLLDDLEGWLGRLRPWVGNLKEAPERHRRALRQVEDAIFAYCQRPGASRLQTLLAALGRAEQAIAMSPKAQDRVRPLHGLRREWARACDDGSAEFRLAAAIASMEMIRAQMEPVTRDRSGRLVWAEDNRGVVWAGGDLCRNLLAMSWRRCVEAQIKQQRQQREEQESPFAGRYSGSLADVHRFLIGGLDDDRIAALIWGCALINWAKFDRNESGPQAPEEEAPDLSRAYALLKLCFLPDPLKWNGVEIFISADLAILARLRAGDIQPAAALAWRRLRGSGLVPLTTRRGGTVTAQGFLWAEAEADRLAAALLIPVWETKKLADMVLRPSEAQVLIQQA